MQVDVRKKRQKATKRTIYTQKNRAALKGKDTAVFLLDRFSRELVEVVVLDNLDDGDVNVNFLWERFACDGHLAAGCVFFHVGRQNNRALLCDLCDHGGVLFVDGEDVTGLQTEAGAVADLAVHENVAMADDLAGCEDRGGQTAAIDSGDESHFEVGQKLVASVAETALGVAVDEGELMLGQIIEGLELLFLQEQLTIGGELHAALGRTMLAGWICFGSAGGICALAGFDDAAVCWAVGLSPEAETDAAAQSVLGAVGAVFGSGHVWSSFFKRFRFHQIFNCRRLSIG